MEKTPSRMSLENVKTTPKETPPGTSNKFKSNVKKMASEISVSRQEETKSVDVKSTVKGKPRNLAVTNPASKIPAFNKSAPKTLSLKSTNPKQTSPQAQSSRPTTPTSAVMAQSPTSPVSRSSTPINKTKMGSMLKPDNLEKKTLNSASKTSLATTSAIKGKASTWRQAKIEAKTNSRSANIAATRAGSTATGNQKPELKSNLRKITSTAGDQNSLDVLEKQLVELQSEFLNKTETMLQTSETDPTKRYEYKLVSLVRQGGEHKLLLKDTEKELPKLAPNSVNDFKEKIMQYMNESFTQLMASNTEAKSDTASLEKIRDLQDSNTKALFSYIDDLCRSYKEPPLPDSEMSNLKKELKEYKDMVVASENKILELKQQHETDLMALKNQFASTKIEEIAQRKFEITELQNKMKIYEQENIFLKTQLQALDVDTEKEEEINALKESLRKSQESTHAMQNNFMQLQEQFKVERLENETKTVVIKKLQNEVQELTGKLEEQSSSNNAESSKEIEGLRQKIEKLELEKSTLEKNNHNLKGELSTNKDMKAKFQAAQKEIKDLKEQLSAKDAVLEKLKSDQPKDVQMEVAKLRQSETEKCREIKKLKVELSKCQFNLTKLEEQIQRDQQLLEIRSDLVNSLQTNETNQRIHLEELMAQVGEKNSIINELQNELRAKSEEFQNLYTNINNKQLELSNQEHMLKLLEESNERSQMLRVQQEEKIGRLEEDIAHLKQTITNTKFGPTPATLNGNEENHSENFYHYASERKRKRQTVINVKKYET
ncbi:salto isoform X2 [Musca autumnalis]|uniref:salto isoform X2 n=1 Tax=Musca autumnalis TaxID=221902 RepID=UPI003CF855EB